MTFSAPRVDSALAAVEPPPQALSPSAALAAAAQQSATGAVVRFEPVPRMAEG